MKITLDIDDALLNNAIQITEIKETTTLVTLALRVLISQESAKKLADLGGSEKNIKDMPR